MSGLLRRHLTSVCATAAIGHAEVKGAKLRDNDLAFVPSEFQSSDYSFDIQSVGMHHPFVPRSFFTYDVSVAREPHGTDRDRHLSPTQLLSN